MNNNISCPSCGHVFDVEMAFSNKLAKKLESEYQEKYAAEFAKSNEATKALQQKLEEEAHAIEQQKLMMDDLLQSKLKEQLAVEKLKLEKQAVESVEEKLKALEEDNSKKAQENKALRQKEVDLMKKEQDLRQKQDELTLTIEKSLLERQQEIEAEATKKLQMQHELEKREYEKKLADNAKLLDEMKRKSTQGSVQLQGEVQELALEELLTLEYPLDSVEEVGKGISGADCVQHVYNTDQIVCGSIVYESKRTKQFSNDWIDKLKQDQFAIKADIAVLVTQTMPSDLSKFGFKDGVWVCQLHEVKSVSCILRQMLVQIHSVKQSQINKGDKMEMLYTYLTSNDFAQLITRIVENYDSMQKQLLTEKKAMNKLWAEREKQIWVSQQAVTELFGSVRGIAGSALADIEGFSLVHDDIKEIENR